MYRLHTCVLYVPKYAALVGTSFIHYIYMSICYAYLCHIALYIHRLKIGKLDVT